MTSCPACGQNIPVEAKFCGACGAHAPDGAENMGLVGKTVANRYRVKRVIAEGGMGVVYEAEQTMGEGVRKVAIKTLLPELSRDPVVVSRFNRECSVIAGLEHPNTVRVYDFGATEDGALYIAMEFVRGRPLGDFIAEGPMPLPRSLNIIEQICSALEEAHEQGIVHRDLKPDNVVLSDRAGLLDVVKVLDFGIAKRSSEGGRHDTKLTQQGMVLGTPPYMSPEQFTGEALDRTSDVYSLGIIFYEMVNGKLPFDGDTPWQWAHQHMSVTPAPFVAKVPPAVAKVVFSALAKQRSGRPPTALELYRRLASACGSAIGVHSNLVEPTASLPITPDRIPSGDAGSLAIRTSVRTEPSMLREPSEHNTLDDPRDSVLGDADTDASRAAVNSVAIQRAGDTEPARPRIASVAHDACPAQTEPSGQVIAAPTGSRGSSVRKQSAKPRLAILSLLALLAVAGGATGTFWWFDSSRGVGDEPALPSVVPVQDATIVIAAESLPPALASAVTNVTASPGRAAAANGNWRPTETSNAPSNTTVHSASTSVAAAGTTATAAAEKLPPAFPPLPFPLALPSPLPPPVLPPTTVPAPAPVPIASAAPPTAGVPASTPSNGIQSCIQASALASTDLDAAVGQYQVCEGAIGRSAAGATRSQIASIGAARARALAAQGKCDEANRVVQTLARIGVHRAAADAAKRSGCPG